MKEKYLIEDSIKNENWLFFDDSKQILGFPCRPALFVNEKNDSTLIWFTDSIPKPAGPLMYFGFEGLVLEISDQVRGWHIVATKIEKDIFGVTMPKQGIIISRQDYISPKNPKSHSNLKR